MSKAVNYLARVSFGISLIASIEGYAVGLDTAGRVFLAVSVVMFVIRAVTEKE